MKVTGSMAPIYTQRRGAFVLSKAVSLSSNAAKNRFLLWAGVCTPAGPFLLPSFSPNRGRLDPRHGRSTCTFDHRVQGHRFETRFSSSSSERERERFRSSLRSEGSTIIVQICGSSWLMGYYRFKEVERWSDHFFFRFNSIRRFTYTFQR